MRTVAGRGATVAAAACRRMDRSGFRRGGGLLSQAQGVRGEKWRSRGLCEAVKFGFFWDCKLRVTFCRKCLSLQMGEEVKLAESSNPEKQIHCLELCLFTLEIDRIVFLCK